MFNIALFGAGRIGRVHGANIASHPETRLAAIIDPDKKAAMKLASKYNTRLMSVSEAMENPAIHAVCIASATDTHADLIERSAMADKAILCEKPIALNPTRIRQCLDIVHQRNMPLLVGFNRRHDPHFALLQQRYAQGAIGKAESLIITSRDPLPPPIEYVKVSGGLFRDMAIHDFDMACFILGESPVSVMARGQCMVDPEIGKAGDIDTAISVLTFPGGAMATIINSRRSACGYDQRIELHGSEGTLTVTNVRENQVQLWNESGFQQARPEYFFLERYKKSYQAQWQHFVEVLANQASPCCNGHDGEQALIIADGAAESLRTGQPVTLPRLR
ncbi:inositol 2-dehydrogenase [Endozoicomonas sp.]|uniref:inositol 2-dehydrogenase n=1 Tax=Endozoicomonas sp. TaxID=1892382 RepID=UPI002883B4AB|nr:inositol 2-dehydrogenase [Endozoicomonas sp.]